MQTSHLPRMLTPDEAAKFLEVRPSTLARWRWAGKGPPYAKYGKVIRYRREDIEAFIQGHILAHTAQSSSPGQ
jgi:predicted site-specific integrase-resolvase